jgi:hypothetical protein
MGQVKIKAYGYHLTVDGFGVWVHYDNSKHQGWNFGNSDAPPVQLLDVFPYWCHLNSALWWDPSLHGIKSEVTGKIVFWVSKKYGYILMYSGMGAA